MRNNVVFYFKNNEHSNYEIQIIKWDQIKSFDIKLKKAIEECIDEHFDKPYSVYYRNIKDKNWLIKAVKELNISQEQLKNPIFDFAKFNPLLSF